MGTHATRPFPTPQPPIQTVPRPSQSLRHSASRTRDLIRAAKAEWPRVGRRGPSAIHHGLRSEGDSLPERSGGLEGGRGAASPLTKEPDDSLHVERLRELVEELHGVGAIAARGEEREIAAERRRIARDVDDHLRPPRRDRLHDAAAGAGARRVEHDPLAVARGQLARAPPPPPRRARAAEAGRRARAETRASSAAKRDCSTAIVSQPSRAASGSAKSPTPAYRSRIRELARRHELDHRPRERLEQEAIGLEEGRRVHAQRQAEDARLHERRPREPLERARARAHAEAGEPGHARADRRERGRLVTAERGLERRHERPPVRRLEQLERRGRARRAPAAPRGRREWRGRRGSPPRRAAGRPRGPPRGGCPPAAGPAAARARRARGAARRACASPSRATRGRRRDPPRARRRAPATRAAPTASVAARPRGRSPGTRSRRSAARTGKGDARRSGDGSSTSTSAPSAQPACTSVMRARTRSPGCALGTNTTRPSSRASPRPRKTPFSIVASTSAPGSRPSPLTRLPRPRGGTG